MFAAIRIALCDWVSVIFVFTTVLPCNEPECFGKCAGVRGRRLEKSTRCCPSQDLRPHCKAPAFIAKPIATTLVGATVLCQTLNFCFVVQVYCAKVFVPIL